MRVTGTPAPASVPRGLDVRFAAMEFLLLGPLEVADDGHKLALGWSMQRTVLAHLILRTNKVVPADLLIDGQWGGTPRQRPQHPADVRVPPAEAARRRADRES